MNTFVKIIRVPVKECWRAGNNQKVKNKQTKTPHTLIENSAQQREGGRTIIIKTTDLDGKTVSPVRISIFARRTILCSTGRPHMLTLRKHFVGKSRLPSALFFFLFGFITFYLP